MAIFGTTESNETLPIRSAAVANIQCRVGMSVKVESKK
jgi:hypothetical protein